MRSIAPRVKPGLTLLDLVGLLADAAARTPERDAAVVGPATSPKGDVIFMADLPALECAETKSWLSFRQSNGEFGRECWVGRHLAGLEVEVDLHPSQVGHLQHTEAYAVCIAAAGILILRIFESGLSLAEYYRRFSMPTAKVLDRVMGVMG